MNFSWNIIERYVHQSMCFTLVRSQN